MSKIIAKIEDRAGSLYVIDSKGGEAFLGNVIDFTFEEYRDGLTHKDKIKYFVELKEAGFTADEILELVKEL